MKVFWLLMAVVLLGAGAALYARSRADVAVADAKRARDRAAATLAQAGPESLEISPTPPPGPTPSPVMPAPITPAPATPPQNSASPNTSTPASPSPTTPPAPSLDAELDRLLLESGLDGRGGSSGDAAAPAGTASKPAETTTPATPSSQTPSPSAPAAVPPGPPATSPAVTPPTLAPAPTPGVASPAKIEPRAEGGVLVDGRFVLKGEGTKEKPYEISWEQLLSAQEVYDPRTGRNDLPGRVTMLDGKYVRLTGYIAFPLLVSSPRELLCMLNQWDGCCIGVPPTPFDAVEVRLRTAAAGDDRFATFGTIEGKLEVKPYIVGNWLVGLYLMDGAEFKPTQFGGQGVYPNQHTPGAGR